MMKKIYENLGWFFCEIAFNTPDEFFWFFAWTLDLGNWFYGLAYEEIVKDKSDGNSDSTKHD